MKRVEVIDVFESNIGVYYAEALLYKDEKPIARVIEGCNIDYVNEKMNYYYQSLEEFFEDYIYSNYDSYLKLPQIDNCSKLLQDIYCTVETSESCMCYISEDEWNNYYDEYSDKDLIKLEKEIKKYNLKDVLTIDEDEYKILAYGDLQTKFIIKNDLEKRMTL